MPKIDKNKPEAQRLAEIHAVNDRTAAYRLRDLASSFKYLSPRAQNLIRIALDDEDAETQLRNLAGEIENAD